MSKLTQDQLEAFLHLLARATRAGCLPSAVHTMCLLDLIEEELPPCPELLGRAA
jgi:hypothetical protein